MDSLKAQDYSYLREILRQRTGIELGQGKTYLVTSRLSELCRTLGVPCVADLVARIRDGCEASTLESVLEAMTTNETYFFRDHTAFDALREIILPQLIERRRNQRRLRIWSAACSTGQEPYSLAMMLLDDFPEVAHWQVHIEATDIAENKVLERASAGRYLDHEVKRGLNDAQLFRHFERVGKHWVLAPTLRRMVKMRKANLLKLPMNLKDFDLILCRNVLIYFDQPTKAQVLESLGQRLRDDGFLVVGASEMLFGTTEMFQMERAPNRAAYYSKRSA